MTSEEFFARKYGEKGSPTRLEFERKAAAYHLAQKLKDERQKLKLTQSQVAEKIHSQKQFISRIENGDVDVQLSTFLAVLDALGLTVTFAPKATTT